MDSDKSRDRCLRHLHPLPYIALVYAVASATSIMAVVPMLIAPALIAIFAGIIYWLSKAVL